MAIHVGAGAGKEGAGPLPPPGTTRWRIFSFRIVCYEANKTVAPLVGSWLTSSLPASSCFPALPTSRPAPCLLSRSSVHPHAIYHYSLTLVDSYTNCETHRDTTIERNKCPLGRRLTQEEQGTLSTSRTPHRTSYQSSPVQCQSLWWRTASTLPATRSTPSRTIPPAKLVCSSKCGVPCGPRCVVA